MKRKRPLRSGVCGDLSHARDVGNCGHRIKLALLGEKNKQWHIDS